MFFALKHNGTTYYYVPNLQGDVPRILDETGAIVAAYAYDPWGRVLSATGTSDCEFVIWDLENVTTNDVFLFMCNGGTLDDQNYSNAIGFSGITTGNIYAAKDGKMNFEWNSGFPVTARGGKWICIPAGN